MQTVLLTNQQNFVLSPDEDTFYLVLLDKKAKNGQVKVDLSLKRTGLNCQLLFLGILTSGSDWQLTSEIKHLASKCSCLAEVYLSQKQQSKVNYFGRIYIAQTALQSKSFLKEQSLIMGQAVYNQSQPTMEIFNNRVQASHSVSISHPDKNALFYLMSRGFMQEEAEKILERAFFNKVLDTVKVVEAHQLIGNYLC
jgi:Fe-S cluster assembly scaffold protein SufB